VFEQLGVRKINWTVQLLVRVSVPLFEVGKKLFEDQITHLVHIFRITREKSAAHTTPSISEILGRILHQRIWNIINVTSGKLVSLNRQRFIQSHQILVPHSFDAEIDPGKMSTLKRVGLNRFFQHNVPGQTKQVVTCRVSVIKLVWFFDPILIDLVSRFTERPSILDDKLVKLAHDILGFGSKFFGSDIVNQLLTFLVAINDQVVRQ
jgi:hypothetical protein